MDKELFIHINKIEEYQEYFNQKEYILLGISDNKDNINLSILEYENSDTILFERA